MQGHKGDIEKLRIEVKKRDGIINSLKTDIEGLQKEIEERDETIQDIRLGPVKITKLLKMSMKGILNYCRKSRHEEKEPGARVCAGLQLRRQMKPRENEIKRMKEQIKKVG